MIRFRCHHCLRTMRIAQKHAGQVTECLSCGYTLRIPLKDGIADPAEYDGSLHDQLLESCETLRNFPPKPSKSTSHKKPSPTLTESCLTLVDLLSQAEKHASRKEESIEAEEKNPTLGQRIGNTTVWALVTTIVCGVLLLLTGGTLYWGSASVGPAVSQPAQLAKGSGDLSQAEPQEISQTLQVNMQGRIRVRSSEGDLLPAKQARIVILPESPRTSRLMFGAGLGATDSPENRNLAQQRLLSAGGAFTLTDAAGLFQVNLNQPGSYYLLVVTELIPAREAENSEKGSLLTSEWQVILSNYFENPQEFLQSSRYELIRVTLESEQTNYFDYDLERS